MLAEDTIYQGRDNSIAVQLTSEGTPIVHNSLTRVQLLVRLSIIDSLTSPAMFDLTNADKIILKLGQAGLPLGRHAASLVVFNLDAPNGIVWGTFMINVVA